MTTWPSGLLVACTLPPTAVDGPAVASAFDGGRLLPPGLWLVGFADGRRELLGVEDLPAGWRDQAVERSLACGDARCKTRAAQDACRKRGH